MYWTDNEVIQKYTNKFGSIFAATAYIAREARTRADECNNAISHAEALSWVITGEKPAIKISNARNRYCRAMRHIHEALIYVEDKAVTKCVKTSLQRSLKCNYLVYDYSHIAPDQESRRARVRILTRMIWEDLRDV